ncbi:MAG TPA: tetratricopeptide repeat protein [Patescibacteria group bacterium]|nr:tetratricopeptide repeat protein [Patescibacteria group bacterium]
MQIDAVMGRKPAHRERIVRTLLFMLLMLCAIEPDRAQEPTARDLCLLGQRQMEAGELQAASESFRSAREMLAHEAPVKEELVDFLALHQYNLGVRFNNAGDAARALDSFMECLRLQRMTPRLKDAAFRDGLLKGALSVTAYLAVTGQAPRALEAYSLIEQTPGIDQQSLAEVSAGRGRILLAAAGTDPARLAAAAEALSDALRRDPGSARRSRDLAGVMARLADVKKRAGEIDSSLEAAAEAERLLRQALTLDPSSPWTRIDLARQLLAARRYEEASLLLGEAEARLSSPAASSSRDEDAETRRRALAETRDNRAVALYNLAVDAVNHAAFEKVEPLLGPVCGVSPEWDRTCRDFRQTARTRQAAFQQAVSGHEKALSANPARAADLLALGDIYANVGDYDKALRYYRRLESVGGATPGLAERIHGVADTGSPTERRRHLELAGAGVELVYYRDGAAADLETALRAAWLRVSALLGADSLQGSLRVTLYPNRRALRERAGYRVGGLVKGNYTAGQVSFFETPAQTVLEWVSVLTHELAHHAVERLSGGGAPRWVSEGIARYVEGETAVVDRAGLTRRLAAPGLPPLTRLGELMERSWNDPEAYLDMRDEALLAVVAMAAHDVGSGPGGGASLQRLLSVLRDPSMDLQRALPQALGMTLQQVDDAWRAALRRNLSEQAP